MKLFVSYALEDRASFEELRKHLEGRGLEVQHSFAPSWFGRRILNAVQKLISDADLIVQLVSPDYFTDGNRTERSCVEKYRQSEHSDVPVIPVLVRPTDPPELEGIRLLNDEPVATSGDRDRAWVDVVRSLKEVIAGVRAMREAAPRPTPRPLEKTHPSTPPPPKKANPSTPPPPRKSNPPVPSPPQVPSEAQKKKQEQTSRDTRPLAAGRKRITCVVIFLAVLLGTTVFAAFYWGCQESRSRDEQAGSADAGDAQLIDQRDVSTPDGADIAEGGLDGAVATLEPPRDAGPPEAGAPDGGAVGGPARDGGVGVQRVDGGSSPGNDGGVAVATGQSGHGDSDWEERCRKRPVARTWVSWCRKELERRTTAGNEGKTDAVKETRLQVVGGSGGVRLNPQPGSGDGGIAPPQLERPEGHQ